MLGKVHHSVQLHLFHAPLKHSVLTDELLAPDMVAILPQIDESVEETEGEQGLEDKATGYLYAQPGNPPIRIATLTQQQSSSLMKNLSDAGAQGDDAIIFLSHTLL